MKPLILLTTLLLSGCASEMNFVHPNYVTMDRAGSSYARDSLECSRIAETRDYAGEAIGQSIARGVTMGVAGGIVGGTVGSVTGNAGLGASVGVGTAAGYTLASSVMSSLQSETATVVWARCMASRGHPVYSIKLH